MSEPIKHVPAELPRTALGIPEKIVFAATVVITLQVLTAIGGVLPMGNWYAGLFFYAGLVSLFGSIGLLVVRRSPMWVVTLAISLLDWFVAYFILLGVGIAGMH